MLWTAFLFGLFGSLHCAGMCGAIALSVRMDFRTRLTASLDALLYNSGRVFTYSLLGLLVGGLSRPLAFFGYQQGLSIATGLAVLLFYFIIPKFKTETGDGFFAKHLKPYFLPLLNSRSKWGLPALGILNGLLPCGFVYMALAAAATAGGIAESGAYMAFFGLGTLPMMTAIPLTRKIAGLRFRLIAQKARPYFVVAVAMLLIVRGMNLGIPYLSPQTAVATGKAACH